VKERIILCFSGGKDSVLALYELLKQGNYEVAALLTTITQDYDRISMHGVRTDLLELQAQALGLPLEKVIIPANSSEQEYEARMRQVMERYLASGIHTVAFGDIFLEDLRKYREENLSKMDIKAIFPLWKNDTAELAERFITLGFEAVVTCVDGNILDERFVGRAFNHEFISQLPHGADPCGENGEFHSFVYNGPLFGRRISHRVGDVVLREKCFYYCDLIPVEYCSGSIKQGVN
jgi:uncharacterized protein (TIGR00290 family)